MPNPTVSILMTTYNAQAYLRAAAASILGQSLTNLELVIVDDGSTDRTRSILAKLAAADRRVRLFNRDHQGVARAANAGLAHCRGRYIARMDSDDLAKPQRLAMQVDYLDQHPDIICVGSDVDLIDARGRYLTTLQTPRTHDIIDRQILAGHGAIFQPSSMIRRQAIEAVGGYDDNFDCAEDLDLWLRLGEIGRLANIPAALLLYRLHSRSVSESQGQYQRQWARTACERAWQRRGVNGKFEAAHVWRPTQSRNSRHAFYLKYGWWAYASRQRRTAIVYACKAAATLPWKNEAWRLLACAAVKPPTPLPPREGLGEGTA